MPTQTIRFGARFIDTNGNSAGGAINVGSTQNAINPGWVVGSAGQQFEQLLALVDADGNAATSAHNARGQLVFGAGADQAFNLADLNGDGRATSLPADTTAADPVLITAHGRTGNTTVGSLSDQVRFTGGDRFGLASRGEDSAAARWLNSGDALDFAVTGGRQLDAVTFRVDFRNGRPGTVVLDTDGDTVVNPAGTRTGFATEGLVSLTGAPSGATVRVDFALHTVTVNGAARSVDSGFWSAVDAAGRDNLTIGSRHDDNSGFAIRDLALTTNTPAPADNPVTARGDTAATDEDAPLTLTVASLLANDSLPDGAAATPLSLPSGTTAQGGTVALLGGSVVYTPAANFSGSDSFTYTATDADGDSATATVTITVRPVNDAPTAADDTPGDVAEDGAATTIAATLLLANDADLDGDTLTITALADVVGGTARLEGGDVLFTPTPGYSGDASFTYTVSDGQGGTATATARFTVTSVNDAPVAADDTASTDEASAVSVAVLANDSDPDRDTLTVTAVAGQSIAAGPVTLASGAVVSLDDDGTLLYDPNRAFERLAQGETAQDSFTYTVSDDQGGTAIATTTITLNGLNDEPLFASGDAAATITEYPDGSPEEGGAQTVQGGLDFTDADLADAHTVRVAAAEAGYLGSLTAQVVQGPGEQQQVSWSYTVADSALDPLAAGETRVQTYTLTLDDGHGGTASRTVTVTLTGAADGPGTIVDADAGPDRVLEGAATGTLVGIDADGTGQGVTYSLSDDAGGRFRIDTATGVVSVANGDLLDFETARSHDITVRATDASGLFTEQGFTVSIIDRAGDEFRVNTTAIGFQSFASHANVEPIVALTDGYLVTWTSNGQDGDFGGIYARRYDASGTAVSGEFQVNATTTNEQSYSDAVALADGGFLVTWSSLGQDGDGWGIYARRYDAGGSAIGSEFQVNTITIDSQLFSDAVALADGGFLVTWTSFDRDGLDSDIYARRYDAGGAAVDGEFRVNTHTLGDQSGNDVAALADGGYLVTWTSSGQDGSSRGIYAQRYNADGSTRGSEFRVNTHTLGDQSGNDVVALADGGFLVSWTSLSQDGSGTGIYAQRYDDAGVAISGEFRVNTTAAGDQAFSDAVALADGGFLITWTSSSEDDIFGSVYAQRYDAGGGAVGSEARINDTIDGRQSNSHLATLPDSDVVAVWEGRGPGDEQGIFARHYQADMLLA